MEIPRTKPGVNMAAVEYGHIAAYLQWECFRCGVLRELAADDRLLDR